MAGQTFEINLESVYIMLNGNDASAYHEHEMIDPQLFVDRDTEGNIVGIEVFGPMKLTTENNGPRRAHRMEQMRAVAEQNGEDVDDATLGERAHARADGGGTAYSNVNLAGIRGEGDKEPARGAARAARRVNEDNEDRRTGSVTNPLTHPDAVEDVDDANARDEANGSLGRHGVAQSGSHVMSAASLEADNSAQEKAAEDDERTQDGAAARESSKARPARAAREEKPNPVEAVKNKVEESRAKKEDEKDN